MTSLRWLFVLALAAGVAFAQPLKVDIPFDFGASNKTFTAGTYLIHFDASRAAVYFDRLQGAGSFAIVATSATRPRIQGTSAPCFVSFRKYGDRLFLGSVARSATIHPVPMSRAERELVTSRIVAERRPMTVIVAAKVR